MFFIQEFSKQKADFYIFFYFFFEYDMPISVIAVLPLEEKAAILQSFHSL